MASEDKLRRDMDRGTRAKALLQNELLQEAFDKIETFLITQWQESKASEPELREDAWRSQKLLKNLKSHLSHIVTTGDNANKELLRMKDPSLLERMRNK